MPRSVILEVALNGFTGGSTNPALPRTPAEVAVDALRCFEAGAAIVHTHLDEFALAPVEAADRYLEAYRRILDARPDAILYPTIGQGETIAERYGHHEHLAKAGAIRAGVFDPGSVNLGSVDPTGHPTSIDFVYANSLSDVEHEVQICARHGLGPSIAIFEPGFLRVVLAYHSSGRLPAGALVKFYFSETGYLGGGTPAFSAPPIPEALALYVAMLGDAALPWAVAVLGGSLLDSPIAEQALGAGGHLRVGLEDEPDAESNLDLVERARSLVESLGDRLATPSEAAGILGLPS
jgi:3-keto-5-aminohexanoate cleavage enzyme